VVAELLAEARVLDRKNQTTFRLVAYLSGPSPPRPGETRSGNEDLSAWKDLVR
jgi:hypothetical protein